LVKVYGDIFSKILIENKYHKWLIEDSAKYVYIVDSESRNITFDRVTKSLLISNSLINIFKQLNSGGYANLNDANITLKSFIDDKLPDYEKQLIAKFIDRITLYGRPLKF
jgi:hypothetical protein